MFYVLSAGAEPSGRFVDLGPRETREPETDVTGVIFKKKKRILDSVWPGTD